MSDDDDKRLRLKQPCRECPFRRNSWPGYLGASTPDRFINSTDAGVQMPCHLTVDYERKDWEQQVEEAPLCAGALIYLKQSCKLPFESAILPDDVNRGIALVLEGIKRAEDNDNVFTSRQEFIDYHEKGRLH